MSEVYERIAVCGAGAMGSGIAQVAAQAGASVKVFDVNAEALAASRKRTLGDLAKLMARGKLTQEQADAVVARMDWVSALEDLADRNLVIEAIIEDAAIKGELFGRIEAIVASDAVIATNTSSLPISRLARGLKDPSRFVGMHFFNPATVMKLVEVIGGVATDPTIAARVAATANAWGKVAIPVADVPGFIVNRVARPYYAEAFTAWSEGVEPSLIDALLRGAGFKMGPLELTDLIGQDVNFAVARSVFDSYFGRTRFVPQLRQAALVDAGWLGRKSGRGVYDYGAEQAARSVGAVQDAPVEAVSQLLKVTAGDFVDRGGVALGRTRGLTAHAEAQRLGRPVAIIDWVPESASGDVGFAASDEAAASAMRSVLAGGGMTAHAIPDRPGLIVARTLAQIANAGADAVLEQVADEDGIDQALRFGANYPFGPFAWADRFGRGALVDLLDAIANGTGEAMYRPSHYLRNRH
jgi:3-hydroxybutyryl-CoA dehydrogenase